jgi:hypothetical protein
LQQRTCLARRPLPARRSRQASPCLVRMPKHLRGAGDAGCARPARAHAHADASAVLSAAGLAREALRLQTAAVHSIGTSGGNRGRPGAPAAAERVLQAGSGEATAHQARRWALASAGGKQGGRRRGSDTAATERAGAAGKPANLLLKRQRQRGWRRTAATAACIVRAAGRRRRGWGCHVREPVASTRKEGDAALVEPQALKWGRRRWRPCGGW